MCSGANLSPSRCLLRTCSVIPGSSDGTMNVSVLRSDGGSDDCGDIALQPASITTPNAASTFTMAPPPSIHPSTVISANDRHPLCFFFACAAFGADDYPAEADPDDRAVPRRRAGRHRRQAVCPAPVHHRRPAGGHAQPRRRERHIGTAAAARAAPDGYTLIFGTTSTMVVNPLVMKNVPYDFWKDFALIGLIANAPHVLAVRDGLPAKSATELVRWQRRARQIHHRLLRRRHHRADGGGALEARDRRRSPGGALQGRTAGDARRSSRAKST